MIRIGGPIFNAPEDPLELAKAHRKCGYTAAYVPSNLRLADSNRIREFAEGFAAEGVLIAEVGAWCNLLAVNAEKRKANFA